VLLKMQVFWIFTPWWRVFCCWRFG